MTLTVSENGAEDLAFAKGKGIDTEYARRWNGGRGSAMSASKQGVTRAKSRSVSFRRTVRRTAGAISAGKRSVKVTAGHA